MKKGFGKVILNVLGVGMGAVAGGAVVRHASGKKMDVMQEGGAKLHRLYMCFDQWLRLRQEGKTWQNILKEKDIIQLQFME